MTDAIDCGGPTMEMLRVRYAVQMRGFNFVLDGSAPFDVDPEAANVFVGCDEVPPSGEAPDPGEVIGPRKLEAVASILAGVDPEDVEHVDTSERSRLDPDHRVVMFRVDEGGRLKRQGAPMSDDEQRVELHPATGPERVRVSLMHTRAADDLVIEFDFERNGWSVQMTPTVDRTDELGCMFDAGPPEEVAFIPAWNLVPDDEDDYDTIPEFVEGLSDDWGS